MIFECFFNSFQHFCSTHNAQPGLLTYKNRAPRAGCLCGGKSCVLVALRRKQFNFVFLDRLHLPFVMQNTGKHSIFPALVGTALRPRAGSGALPMIHYYGCTTDDSACAECARGVRSARAECGVRARAEYHENH